MTLTTKPVFIIGNPRSGTTLLRLILNAHSKFVVPPEAGFAFWLYQKYREFSYTDLKSFLEEMKETKKIRNWNLDWNRLEDYLNDVKPHNYGELIDHIYKFYAQSTRKKVYRWGDKNNFYLDHIDEIKEVFPNAYFIHIVRDGRNVACSYKKLNKKQIISEDAPNLPDKIESIANEWKSNIQKIRKSFKKFDYQDVLEIRLEDLTTNPEEVIRNTVDFIGEDFESAMLEYHKTSTNNQTIPEDYLQWKKKNTLPIQDEPADKYKMELTKDQIAKFNFLCGDLLVSYGYKLD